MRIGEIRKFSDKVSNLRVKCWYCGHSLLFNPHEKVRKLCNWCRRYNYRSKNIEFKVRLMEEIKREK